MVLSSGERVTFLDTTLRDGEQAPGVSLRPEDKLRIAERLDELNIDVIEAGFAAVSEGEMQAVRRIAEAGLKAEICSMARGVTSDIDAVLTSGAKSIALVIPTSDIHLRYKLRKKRADILKVTEKCVRYAKDHGLIVELLAEDATRTDFDFLSEMFEMGVSSGADRICPCDTVGTLTPESSYELFQRLRKTFTIPIAVHCHNDFGMAVSNSLAALRAGANEVHVTVNGIGERAGNAALEEVVIALRVLHHVDLSINTKLLHDVSRLVSRLTGMWVQPHKPIVGENAFVHESGIHTHGILRHPLTYEPIAPELVGVRRRFVVGKHVGKAGLRAVVRELGLKPNGEQFNEIFGRVKALGDRGKKVTDADLLTIAETTMGLPKEKAIKLKELTVVTGDKVTPTASVQLSVGDRELSEAATGVGPVDAALNAIKKAVSAVASVRLEEYKVKAITGGTDAVVDVSVRLRRGSRVVTSRGARGDIVMASVEAMLSGINVLLSSGKLNKAFKLS
ncbi:MAG: 2-isopropylmalate synthase [Candidatus Bathyarchaeia archaeon]